ncbi:MAG: ChbG/HpnK family deacetylase [Oscillospiraceae bacterium]|nr:ChbG/HpnK family deacetylase [Oscillospiraceae bacterium]
MKVIINADDFGFSKSVNEGIMYAFEKGLISSTTMMMNQPGTDEACELWKANPQISVGLHINLTAGKALTENFGLTDNNGEFYNHRIINKNKVLLIYGELYNEIEAQLLELMRFGTVDHIDAHHFINHYNEDISKAMHGIALKYGIPIRNYRLIQDKYSHFRLPKIACKKSLMMPQKTVLDFYNKKAKTETIKNIIEGNKDLETLEIMCHVGFIDEETKSRTSYLTRETEIRELEKLKKQGFYDTFELVTFKDL